MIKLYDGGAYLVNGNTLVADDAEANLKLQSLTGKEIDKEAARKETMAYGILQAHNTSGDPKKLKVRFDALTSHDITFVGIIQTARASAASFAPRMLTCGICIRASIARAVSASSCARAAVRSMAFR